MFNKRIGAKPGPTARYWVFVTSGYDGEPGMMCFKRAFEHLSEAKAFIDGRLSDETNLVHTQIWDAEARVEIEYQSDI